MSSAETDQTDKKNMPTLAEHYHFIIEEAAKKLKKHMEQVNTVAAKGQGIIHSVAQYEHILHEEFPRMMSSTSQPQGAQEQDTRHATTEATPGKIQIREIIDKVKQEILNEVFMAIGDKGQEAKTGSIPAQGPRSEEEILGPAIKDTIEKMEYIQKKIIRQLHINGIVAKIKNHLKREETVIILKVDDKYASQWEQTRIALSLLPCIAVVMILTKTETNLKRAKEEYCHPKGELIDYSSLAELYHSIVLEITGLQKSEYNDDAQILHTIMDKCESNEFGMKIFAHALYANPNRSKEELHRLHNNLQVLPQKSHIS